MLEQIDAIRPLARVMHLLLSFVAVLVVYWLIWSTSPIFPMKASRWLSAAFVSLSAGLFMHWFLDVVVQLP